MTTALRNLFMAICVAAFMLIGFWIFGLLGLLAATGVAYLLVQGKAR